jgi:hypothetical protein
MEEIVPTQTLLGYNAAGLPLTAVSRKTCPTDMSGENHDEL